MLTVFTLATKTLFASTLPGRLRVPVADLSATASGSATISTSVKQERTNAMHVQADCSNVNGSYKCQCRSGWSGDGYVCAGLTDIIPI